MQDKTGNSIKKGHTVRFDGDHNTKLYLVKKIKNEKLRLLHEATNAGLVVGPKVASRSLIIVDDVAEKSTTAPAPEATPAPKKEVLTKTEIARLNKTQLRAELDKLKVPYQEEDINDRLREFLTGALYPEDK